MTKPEFFAEPAAESAAEPTQGPAPVAAVTVPRGQEPKASPAVRAWAVVLGAALVAAACVCGREVWRVTVEPTEPSWIQPAVDVLSRPDLETWMLWGGAAGIAVGLFFLIVSLRGRKSTHLAVAGEPSTWIRHVDVARRCSAIARSLPGVTAARTVSARKGVRIIVNGDRADAELIERVRAAVAAELKHLATPPALTVELEHLEEVDANV